MPRANRYITEGAHYHVTHRCHDRRFLLKFARDRRDYRSLLRSHLQQSEVSLLGYCITSNHVHLLMKVDRKEALSELMQAVAGEFAQSYNRRKGRSGAFWGDRYHATLVDSEAYLLRCLRYIDLNMVRAGVVDHPKDWEFCGYRELFGLRRRYRLIDQERLFEVLEATAHPERLLETYRLTVEEVLAQRAFAREAMWTESLAVGSEAFVKRMEATIRDRSRLETSEAEEGSGSEPAWVLREAPPENAYGRSSGPEIASKAP